MNGYRSLAELPPMIEFVCRRCERRGRYRRSRLIERYGADYNAVVLREDIAREGGCPRIGSDLIYDRCEIRYEGLT